MDIQKIGVFLSELRKEKNLTQDELGEQIGVTNKTVSRWENGNYLPPVEIIQILSKFYGVSINEILNGERINVKSALNRSNVIIRKHKKIMNWIIAIVVALLYIVISLISQKWQYTWIVWIVYCAYRTVESIVNHFLNIHVKSK